MASMGKLYPPIIANTIPAFYAENGTVKITVPFSMSRAVSKSQIKGFSLKVKTAQSNTFIFSAVSNEVETAMNAKVVTFYKHGENQSNLFKTGLFYKFQLAYIANDDVETVGYYSTVAVGKCTTKPTIYIQDAEVKDDPTGVATFRKTYLGVYELGDDQSERPYSYNFYLYDANGLVEESGWLLHNTMDDDAYNEKLQLHTIADKYTFKTTLKEDSEYYIQYGVRTINNLEVFSRMYACIEPSPQNAQMQVSLNAENIFEEGYVNLSISLNNQNASLTNPVSVEVCRAEKTDNFQSWVLLRKVYFSSYEKAVKWSMKDFTIEQGITYMYCLREYNKFGIYNQRILSNPVVADFEDMFLYDGKKQLKIRFNPKMSSFKATKLEQKLDTIGNKYPFIFKNGIVDYKEFPISGLISYKVDNNELFVNHKEDLNIILGKYPRRLSSPAAGYDTDMDDDGALDIEGWQLSETLDSVGYNIRAERRFKLKVLEWLNDSEVKLFRSPTEGSYLVRLMNVSMTPEDRLGRMLHNFSCQAYEVDELNYDNLLAYGFITLQEKELTDNNFESVFFCDRPDDHVVGLYQSIKINRYDIYNYLRISTSPNTGANSIYLRIGSDSPDSKTLITGQKGFMLQQEGMKLPDIYFNLSDNIEFLNSSINTENPDSIETTDAASLLLGGRIRRESDDLSPQTGYLLEYNYITVDIASGDIIYENGTADDTEFVKNIYLSTATKTVEHFGSYSSLKDILGISDRVGNGTDYTYYTFNKVFGITFYKKQELEITESNNSYYLTNGQQITPSHENIYVLNGNYYYVNDDSTSLIPIEDVDTLYTVNYKIDDTNIYENFEIDNTAILTVEPENFDVNAQIYTGRGVNFVVTYQLKIVQTSTVRG